ncbi:MAG TPA: hypothetical protein VF114_05400 [Candidatus Limnocylindria bacterium]
MNESLGWVLLVSGILVAGYAALVGVVSMEVTLLLVIFGLADAVVGLVLVLRSRRAA